MKKGFTLIELLAVIVILAIIALIATPIVLNIINDARESSKIRSAELYIGALEQAIVKEKMNNIGFNPSSCEIRNNRVICDGEIVQVDIDGTNPSSGYISLNNGKVNKNETYIDFEKDQVSYNENGDLVLGISESYEAIEIVRNYIKGIEIDSPANGVYSVCGDDPEIDEYPGAYMDIAESTYICELENNAPNVQEFPEGGVFVVENGKVVQDGYANSTFYITYFLVGEYYVYFGADGELATTTLNIGNRLIYGEPFCVASNQLTYDVGLLASEGNPYAKGVEYKCTEGFGRTGTVIKPNEYFVLDVQGDNVKLISSNNGDSIVFNDFPGEDYTLSQLSGPTYDEIYSVNNSIDLTNSPWLTIQAPYYLSKSLDESVVYYVSETKEIQELSTEQVSLYEVKILEYNKSKLLY